MKRIYLLTLTLILGTIAAWAQTNALSFTIYPVESGLFTIWYSTKDAPSTNVMEVDWGNGAGVQVYNGSFPTGSDPTKKIEGMVNRLNPIQIYSNCIEAIFIVSIVRGIRCGANNPYCQYIYYFGGSLSAINLEAFYMSLNDGSNFGWGELHLTEQDSISNAGDNILRSNAFIAADNDWRICSFKSWTGSISERMNWSLSESLARTHLKPAITLQTSTTADMTDLQIGIMEGHNLPWYVLRSFVRIDDGTTNYNALEVLRYETNDAFVSNSPNLTIKGTGTTGLVKIYGALVSHFKTDQIGFLDLNNTKNLRYLYINNCNNFNLLPGLYKQIQLEYLDLDKNANLMSVDVSLAPIKQLRVQGCSSLTELYFRSGILDFLNISECSSLPRKKISSLRHALKLNSIYAENLGWDACDLDSFYNDLYDLRPSIYYPGLISVDDYTFTTPPNDWAGSNKTIARDKGWDVVRYENGSYTSLYGDGGGCTTGISQAEAAKFITVFPNPANDVVNITLVPNLNAECLEVIDVTGKTIFSVPVSPTELEIQINVSDYAKGIYLIRVGHYTHKMLVK